MNNGKVRIYELSRELDLENKDILGICERLNIAVKSHSSTISESEAESIRSAAEKQAAARPASRARASIDQRKTAPPAAQSVRPRLENKPQILEIRQHKSGSGSNAPQQPGEQVAIPPQPPVRQQTPSPMKPTSLNKPVRHSQRETTPVVEVVEEEKLQVDQVEAPPSPAPKAVEPAPQLVEPPMRQAGERPGPSNVERPVLKRAKVETAISSPVGAPQKVGPASGAPERNNASAPPAPVRSERPAAPAPPRVPELHSPPQRPVRPSMPVGRRPGGAGDTQLEPGSSRSKLLRDESDEGLGTPDALGEEARKPNPPRLVGPNKRKPEWEDEEEENPDKAGKAGAKAKRRVQPLIEDDEDFESDLEELPAALQVSLSVARPPKQQKARPASPVVVAAEREKRKPQMQRGEGQSNDRDRRREPAAKAERPENLVLTGSMTVQELATALAVQETEIIKTLFFKGFAINITQTLDIPTITMVAKELGVEVETQEEQAAATKVTEMVTEEDLAHLQRRPPVVTIMGHVDHGKTTLLDSIRKTKVAQGEAGGITQHIGAYHVDVEYEGKTQQVVFLDTPGHEAFTAMRARGTRVTDIAVLVVAADDGVQPQTIEAISHAKAAEVPIVVAINKVDKPDAQQDRVKQELTQYGLQPEEWGGDTIMVPVSAIKGENLDTLLEMILIQAEVLELSANPDRAAKGTVIEANLDKSRGPVATLLVQNGTLRVGDVLVVGSVLGKVRAMIDDRGDRVTAAAPSFAVEVLGLSDVPAAGDEFEVYPNEKEGRAIASARADEQRQSRLQQVMASRRVTLNSLSAQAQEGDLKELNLVLKADVQGSVEALLGALGQLPQNEVQVRVLLAAPGEVTETDVDLAAASGAVIVGFNTTLASGARQAADQAGVDVREYNIIYKLLDDIQGAMEGLLEPEQVEEPLGQVEVRAVFPVGRGSVAGCYVLSGKVVRNCRVRVRRNSQVVHDGVLDSLKRMKEDAKEVNAGYECGIGVDRFNAWVEGDIIEAYQMVSKRRTLSPN